MNDTMKRLFFFAMSCIATYVVLHVLRSFSVEAETRGVWAGAVGFLVAMADHIVGSVSRQRRMKRSR